MVLEVHEPVTMLHLPWRGNLKTRTIFMKEPWKEVVYACDGESREQVVAHLLAEAGYRV